MSFANILKQADIFFELTPTQLELIASLCHERRCKTGDVIFEENAPSDELYIIAQGEVEIQVDPSLVGDESARHIGPVTIATLRRGQSFGEVALVDQGLRSAAARCAAHNTQLLIIPRDKLMMLCDTYPQLGYRMMRNLAADLALKIRNTDLRIREELLYGRRR
ncbi:MAG: cyclic nucleotide-binding domain-containing protein [Chloroflexi bacterium]|nr:cyclic nucleotide-binding domain-containing protein [Chloroflexota bacterium]MBI3761417.1 cyclic nucleotide-binding domain-containing protein [Chloroflexota bacterium]